MASTVTLRNNFFIDKEEMKMAETKVQMTNADRIRAMSDEELAEMLTVEEEYYMKYDEQCIEWLRQQAEGE